MIEIETRVFYWTKQGMRETAPLPHCVGYIQRGEVERLLEEAHARGRAAGVAEAASAAAFEFERHST